MTPPRTVTVGRVVLQRIDDKDRYQDKRRDEVLGVVLHLDGDYRAWARVGGIVVDARADTRDDAADALTAKLVALRTAIDGVLGEGK